MLLAAIFSGFSSSLSLRPKGKQQSWAVGKKTEVGQVPRTLMGTMGGGGGLLAVVLPLTHWGVFREIPIQKQMNISKANKL